MPSSPQTVTTRGVFDYLESTSGKPIIGATINCTLNFNGSSVTSPIVNLGELQQSVITDQNGFWRFLVVPNDTITPTGTLYTIQTPVNTYEISVPSGGADVQSSSIVANAPSVLSPALTNLTGPITVTGNESVTGNLSVTGTTTLGSTTTGALTTAAETVGGDLTIANTFRLLFATAIAKIVPGVTSISHRNNADNADNLLITDAGAVTVRNGLTVTAGGATVTAGGLTVTAGGATVTAGDLVVTAGRLLVSAAVAKIVPGITSLSLRNNADSADNLILTDVGLATLRNALLIPPSAAGTVAPTSYGTVPIKIAEQIINVATASVTFSSLPSGFRHLNCRWRGRTDNAAAQTLNLTVNGDAGANYTYQSTQYFGAAISTAQTSAANSARIGVISDSGQGAQQSTGDFRIIEYSTALNHQFEANNTRGDVTAFGGERNNVRHGGTAGAITSFTLAAGAGNIASMIIAIAGEP